MYNSVASMINDTSDSHFDGYTAKLSLNFQNRGKAQLRSIISINQHINLLQSCRWLYSYCSNLSEFLNRFFNPIDLKYPIENESFDEFAALALLRHRYLISVSSNHHLYVKNLLIQLKQCMMSDMSTSMDLNNGRSIQTAINTVECTDGAKSHDRLNNILTRVDLLESRISQLEVEVCLLSIFKHIQYRYVYVCYIRFND
jgi:hypothetical protein